MRQGCAPAATPCNTGSQARTTHSKDFATSIPHIISSLCGTTMTSTLKSCSIYQATRMKFRISLERRQRSCWKRCGSGWRRCGVAGWRLTRQCRVHEHVQSKNDFFSRINRPVPLILRGTYRQRGTDDPFPDLYRLDILTKFSTVINMFLSRGETGVLDHFQNFQDYP
eukprot:SAG11_NODE_1078_length_5963_cov_5.690825_1_plen_168_part_00